MQNYKEKRLIFSPLRNHHCEQGEVNSIPVEMGGGGEGTGYPELTSPRRSIPASPWLLSQSGPFLGTALLFWAHIHPSPL